MEFTLPELLSRDDILNILHQRRLHVNNMNELTHNELLRVYKTFVMPLSKRPQRSKNVKHDFKNTPLDKNGEYEGLQMRIESGDNMCSAMEIDFNCQQEYSIGQLTPSCRIDSTLREKRRLGGNDEDILESNYQYELSSATKRIRINSLY